MLGHSVRDGNDFRSGRRDFQAVDASTAKSRRAGARREGMPRGIKEFPNFSVADAEDGGSGRASEPGQPTRVLVVWAPLRFAIAIFSKQTPSV